MSDVTRESSRAVFEWQLVDGSQTATRTFSIDDVPNSAAGVSSAKAFRDAFLNGTGLSLAEIEPRQFWQPTGWRDNDLYEAPWTTVGCNVKIVSTTETVIDTGESDTQAQRLIAIREDGKIYFAFADIPDDKLDTSYHIRAFAGGNEIQMQGEAGYDVYLNESQIASLQVPVTVIMPAQTTNDPYPAYVIIMPTA